MFKKIAVAIVVVVAAVLIFAATRPDIFRVERATSIKAPPEKIFAFVNDFHRWQAWSPWEKKDPAMKRTFINAMSGMGAVYAWSGNKDVGEGSMEITDSVPPSRIALKLDFIKPFEGHNIVEFTLEPAGDTTKVTWTMQGPTPFLGKIMHVFINMDDMVGRDFEAGLADLKAAAEK